MLAPDLKPHHAVIIRIADSVYKLLSGLIRLGMVWVVAWAVVGVAKALAGQDTNANFLLKMVFEHRLWLDHLPWGLFLLTMSWALRERSLRHQKVEAMQGRIKLLEEKKDPRRSSSGLTVQGKTNPADL